MFSTSAISIPYVCHLRNILILDYHEEMLFINTNYSPVDY